MRVALGGLLALFVGVGAAQAEDKPAEWLKRPTPGDLAAVWPSAAFKRGLGGRATIDCKVGLEGVLSDCNVVSEFPAGEGFGAAAIALTPQLLMKPASRDGVPVLSRTTVALRFQESGPALGTLIQGNDTWSRGGAERRIVTKVNWDRAPSFEDVAKAYPRKAREQGLAGRAVIRCLFTDEGAIGACQIVSEEPPGKGFGAAARSLKDEFRTAPVLEDGSPAKGAMTDIHFLFKPELLGPAGRQIGKVQWAALPSGQAVAAGYPAAAAKAGVELGRVMIACEVGADRRLSGCAAESATPAGLGFEESALALASGFQVKPWSLEGAPIIGGRIRVPLKFELPRATPAQ